MFKVYQAGSDLSFSVKMKNGQRRIVFEPQSHGTSVYSTRNTDEQNAMEKHYWFNDKFWILEEVDEKKAAAEAKKKAAVKAKKAEEEKTTYMVEDLQDAKDYLADKFGVSRSKMKTKEEILAIAKENNVVLEGLD